MRFKEIVLEVYLNTDNQRVKTSFKKEIITDKYSQLPLKPTNKNINGLRVYLHYPEKTERERLEVLLKNEKTGEFLGILLLKDQPHRAGSFVFSDIDLDTSMQGGTTAIKLYAYVIKELGYTIVTDDVQTKGALGIWKRLAGYPGILVYQWDLERDKFSVWSPSDSDSAYVSSDDMAAANKEHDDIEKKLEALLKSGKIDDDEYNRLLKQFRDHVLSDFEAMDEMQDYRLVATRQRGLGRR